MNNDKLQLIEAIEQLNIENRQLRSSKEYKLGKKMYSLMEIIKKMDIKQLIAKVSKKRKNKKEQKYLQIHLPQDNGVEYEENIDTNKKIVIYTCITGNYDNIVEPLYIPENVKYVLYTNSQKIKTSKWEIREIPESISKLENNILINRYIKMHPYELFKNEYDYAIYIDGNIRTVSDISSFVTKVKPDTGLALHRHYIRDCVYMEAEACKLYKRGNLKKLQEQIKRYEIEKMPKHYGLLEANVIVTDLKNEVAVSIQNNWWEEFINSQSNRDQISLIYVLWKMGYNVENIGNLGYNVHNNKKIEIISHLKR